MRYLLKMYSLGFIFIFIYQVCDRVYVFVVSINILDDYIMQRVYEIDLGKYCLNFQLALVKFFE